jgi:DNA primase
MDSQIEEIKNRLNVLDIVGNYVKLTKTGINYRGICPFHSEKGPSFFVSPTRQMWKCFGCGKGGDIFEFIKEIEGLEFGDALKILATKAGIELKRENPQLATERHRLYEICELACSFFEKQLESSEWGKKAKDYLLKRGIIEESIKKWRLGYSPDTWQGLSDFLVGRGYNRDEIVKAGLAVQSDKGNNPYDRFRGRIIFPIFDTNSQVIGFGARIFKEIDKKETAKYINTPKTLLYDKSNVLYGINFAKVSVRKNNQCVLTEGYTDAIMCHQAGFENTVAVSGTALTPRHLILLKRYTNNLLLAFDMDLAGDNATKRGINLAESQGFNLKIIDTYSGAKDPAEIILENPKNWAESMEKARTIMDYYFDSAFLHFDRNSPEGKKEIAKIILLPIKRLQSKIEQSFWTQKLADKLQISESAILEELKNVKMDNSHLVQSLPAVEIKKIEGKNFTIENRKRLLENKILSLILKSSNNLEIIKESDYDIFSDATKELIEKIKKSGADFVFADSMEMEKYKDVLSEAFLKEDTASDPDMDDANEIMLCLKQLRDIQTRQEMGRISNSLREEKDENKEEELKKEFNTKAKELHIKK